MAGSALVSAFLQLLTTLPTRGDSGMPLPSAAQSDYQTNRKPRYSRRNRLAIRMGVIFASVATAADGFSQHGLLLSLAALVDKGRSLAALFAGDSCECGASVDRPALLASRWIPAVRRGNDGGGGWNGAVGGRNNGSWAGAQGQAGECALSLPFILAKVGDPLCFSWVGRWFADLSLQTGDSRLRGNVRSVEV